MALQSSLVTAPSVATVKKYAVTVPSSVSGDTLAVDDKAQTYYNAIYKSYTDAYNAFNDLAKEYRSCASSSVKTGASLKKALNDLANKCSEQGQFCLNRRKQLSTNFEFAELQNQVQILTDAIKALQ